ncbi:hypothetical protein HT136_09725 [Novosphingobium profundi]|uniref:hypothetical protein n=1 Tax=Novosphingobium profundi TaxID=1774954 RepID=UPI001BD9B918|nr:hypothetical protein [Novosphingobium profundi]MBT0668645.1 hypothetical protein [Novosphingobium profundi]
MAQLVKQIARYPRVLAESAQPVIIAFSVAGFTGGALSAIGILAGEARRRTAAGAQASVR